MGRLSRMLSKAGDIVQQANEEYQRARQQQQGQYGQPQGQPSQWHAQYQLPARQQQQQDFEQLQRQFQAEKQEVDRLAAQYKVQCQQEIQDANRELERLKKEQQNAEAQAGYLTQFERDKQEVERLAQEYREVHHRQMRSADEEMARLKSEQQILQQEAVSQMEMDRQVAERLAAEYQAEYEREIQADQVQQAQDELEKLTLASPAVPPPLPPRVRSEPQVRGVTTAERPCYPNQTTPTYPSQSASSEQQQYYAHPPSQISTTCASGQTTASRAQSSQPGPSIPYSKQAKAQVQPKPTDPPVPHPSGVTPLHECANSLVAIPLTWFFHSSAPSFPICTRCYVDHIYDTPFASSFSKYYVDDKQSRKCFFGSARVKEQLWPAALSSRSLSAVVEFMQKRQGLGVCSGCTIKEGEKWYTTKDIPGMAFCQACYEDDLLATPFGSHFRLEALDSGCFCDFSTFYMRRVFEANTKTLDWPSFVDEAKARLQFPACPKDQGAPADSRAWFVSKRGPQGLQLCVACYCDYFHGTPDAEAFERATGKGNIHCVMGRLNVIIPMQEAVERKDLGIFWRNIREVFANPFCDGDGTKGTWYTLPSNPPGFGICGACYSGIVKALRGEAFFIPKPGVSRSDTLLCCFNPNHARVGGFIQSYSDALLTSTWRPLADYAVRLGNVRLCPRSKPRTGVQRKWWGWPDMQICEECYLTVAEGTALEPQYQLNGHFDTKARICDLYSPRMRALYAEACETGDLASFLSFATQRRLVYVQTVPVMDQMLQEQKLAAMQAQTLGIMGSAYKNMGAVSAIGMGHSYTVGNAYAGYGYDNELSLQGAVYDRQSREVGASLGSRVLKVSMLEQRWKAVE